MKLAGRKCLGFGDPIPLQKRPLSLLLLARTMVSRSLFGVLLERKWYVGRLKEGELIYLNIN